MHSSEQLDSPVLLRTTTRVAHVKGVVAQGKTPEPAQASIAKMPAKFVMLPGLARARRAVVEKRMAATRALVEELPENRMEDGATATGFHHRRRLLSLRQGGLSRRPRSSSSAWAGRCRSRRSATLPPRSKELYVVEELDPFLETQIKAMGIPCHGKDLIPALGELNSFIVRNAIDPDTGRELFAPLDLPLRPPNMCAGCPHRGLFYSLSRMKDVFVSGDIGCYTLGALPPLSAMDSCVCMGASVTVAHGMAKALGKEGEGKVVAVHRRFHLHPFRDHRPDQFGVQRTALPRSSSWTTGSPP